MDDGLIDGHGKQIAHIMAAGTSMFGRNFRPPSPPGRPPMDKVLFAIRAKANVQNGSFAPNCGHLRCLLAVILADKLEISLGKHGLTILGFSGF